MTGQVVALRDDQRPKTLADLKNSLDRLNERDRMFAENLISWHAKRGLSDKQWYWVGQLAARANHTTTAANQNVGDLTELVNLLTRAREHLKRPAIIIRANDHDLRLSIAGDTAKVPGSINVCSIGSFTDRDWYGRVTREGEFQPSQKYDGETLSAIGAALAAMALDPAKAAAEYGHLTGVCCFCAHPLTDERSTSVGYGPICAGHFGLPWGENKTVATAGEFV